MGLATIGNIKVSIWAQVISAGDPPQSPTSGQWVVNGGAWSWKTARLWCGLSKT